ncbi:MAG: hypothetical protein KY476_23675 [Planctomycetes bacterium]|nr:hypothetical protein [Planctomycetota bacterium]
MRNDSGESIGRGRRRFLISCAASAASALTALWLPRPLRAEGAGSGLVAGIERSVIFGGRRTGVTWFHPRACIVPTTDGARALMTPQTIGGSDYFGPVHFTVSRDGGRSWTDPEPIPGFGRRKLDDGYEVGVCDVVPEYHAPTRSVLAVGHNVYYKAGRLARP